MAGLEPATNGVNDISSLYALPTELHDTPYIFPHTSSWQPHQPTPYDAEPIRTIGLAIRILYSIRSVCCRSTATIFGLQFSQPSLGLVLLPASLIVHIEANSWLLLVRNLPRRLRLYLRVGYRLFPLHPLEVSFAAVSAQGFARPLAGLLATHLAIVYSVYSAYLPGLHAARPSAFVEGSGLEPPAHPKLFGDSPPMGRTAVAFISVGVRGLNHSPYSNLAGLHPYSGFSFLVLYVAMP